MPANNDHDIFKFGDIAYRVKVKGRKCYQLGKVIALRPVEGVDILSVNSLTSQNAAFRCSVYSSKKWALNCSIRCLGFILEAYF